jgi:succinoglycan biosynthesis transport protein ExoP
MSDRLEERVPRGWEEYFAIVVRRRWWILLPLFLCWIAVWGGSWSLPTTYTSDALISAEQEKVSDLYVMENVNVNLQNRLQSTTQKVLSYASLQAIIERFKLYVAPPRTIGFFKPKDPVDQMRSDIKIELVGAPGYRGEFFTFKIHYSADTPELAQQVNTELTSLFINENVRAQRQLSENTTAFLDSELADARIKMQEQKFRLSRVNTQETSRASYKATCKSWQACKHSWLALNTRWTLRSNRRSIWNPCCSSINRLKRAWAEIPP